MVLVIKPLLSAINIWIYSWKECLGYLPRVKMVCHFNIVEVELFFESGPLFV